MKPHHIEGLKLLFLLGICGAVLLAHENDARASTVVENVSQIEISDVIFTNENWNTVTHPGVATFSVDDSGNASGVTDTGIPFALTTVINEPGIRVQRFAIQEHYHFIVNGTAVFSEQELSTALAQQYHTDNVY